MNVFLSYSRSDVEHVQDLAADIGAIGLTCWFDRELSGGESWWSSILKSVRDCDLYVFALSRSSLDSTACQREYEYAHALGKTILPVLVNDQVSANLLPPALCQIQFVDYRLKDKAQTLSLARALQSVSASPPLPDPLPAEPPVPLSYLSKASQDILSSADLPYQRQAELLVDLKKGLRDAATVDDALELVYKFRGRRDVFAAMAEELDELIALIKAANAKPSEVPAPAQETSPKIEPAPPNPPQSQAPTEPEHSVGSTAAAAKPSKKPVRKVAKKKKAAQLKDNRGHPLFKTFLKTDSAYKAMGRDDQIRKFSSWMEQQESKHGNDLAVLGQLDEKSTTKFKDPEPMGCGGVIACTIIIGIFFSILGVATRSEAIVLGLAILIIGVAGGLVHAARKAKV